MACDANTAMSRGLEQTQYEKSPILSTATASVTHACRGSFFYSLYSRFPGSCSINSARTCS